VAFQGSITNHSRAVNCVRFHGTAHNVSFVTIIRIGGFRSLLFVSAAFSARLELAQAIGLHQLAMGGK
jgi:hypothetical protein